ncbi:methionine ABC transporter permease [Acidipropionibacterium jensenii]|uniref:methionine ABC transporter permease n=1 Tax=Acidipropionibacterium jensenii TaxID=1749 RepID=UPI002649CBCC|nr:methionine ABC transporter permease [Acidipropionibacterium jensenii]MDN6762632.1 ABC transporter permease [Acidipropionibacterium jensenii]
MSAPITLGGLGSLGSLGAVSTPGASGALGALGALLRPETLTRPGLAPTLGNWVLIQAKLPQATWETIAMVAVSTTVTLVLGLPLGVLLTLVAPGGLRPNRGLHVLLSLVVNIGRSTPFIILMIALIPLTRLIAGTSLGWQAACVPLSVGAVPFFARLVENALSSVPPGVLEASQMAGASLWRTATGVLVREAIPSLLAALTVTAVTLVSYSAMAGTVGGGGLGTLAYYYGYQRFMPDVMTVTIVLTIVLVQVLQFAGDRVVSAVSRG